MCEAALISIDKDLVACIVPVMVSLGKLSKFCVSSDWDAKAGYCRMAAELSKIPFSESVGHPSVHAILIYIIATNDKNKKQYFRLLWAMRHMCVWSLVESVHFL